VIAFQCAHSGLYFAADYFREWGRKYGRGCGPHPFSIVWDSDYHTPPAEGKGVDTPEQVMHPVRNCEAQLDRVEVTEQEFKAKAALHDGNDPTGTKRAAIMRKKQLANPRCHMAVRAAKKLMEDAQRDIQ
jgi:hypothetical protein